MKPGIAGLIAAAFVLAFQGCSTTREPQPAGERIICIPEHLSVGARVRVRDNTPLGPWVDDEFYIVKSIHGRSRHCQNSAILVITARAIPESRAMAQLAKAREDFRSLASIAAGDVFPSGALHLATHTFRKLGKDEGAAWLVVNFDAVNEKGERSYVADATAHCGTGVLSVAWWTTFRLANGGGAAVNSGAHSPSLTIDKPSAALAAAVRAICASGP